jgi:hypothetical protein
MLVRISYVLIFVLVSACMFSVYHYVAFQERMRVLDCSTPIPLPYIKGRIINRNTQQPIQDAEVTIRRVRTREPSCEGDYLIRTIVIRTNDLGEFMTGYTAESWMKFQFVIAAEGCETEFRYDVSGSAFFEGPIILDGMPDFFLDCGA